MENLQTFKGFINEASSMNNENNIEFEREYCSKDEKFRYQLLSRMQSDCEYALGNGRIYGNHFWAGNEKEQIRDMMSLWLSLNDKPEWLSLDQINNYSKEMTGKSLTELGYDFEGLKKEYNQV